MYGSRKIDSDGDSSFYGTARSKNSYPIIIRVEDQKI
jgi:hypothetical protein